MIRHRKRHANALLSATRNKSLHSLRPRAGSAHSSEIKPESPRASQLAFFEDFTGEHSLLRQQSTSIGIPGAF